jgi:exodeoxyribonuclease V alpha subunit
MDKEYQEIKGSAESVIYQNEESGYTVLKLLLDGGGTATAVGCLPFVVSGEQLVLRGQWVTHPIHGAQFKIEQADRLMPQSVKEIYQFLSSGIVKGVGPATARSITDHFGEDSLRILEEEPGRLTEIKGITDKRAKEICSSYVRQTSLRRLMEFFVVNDIKLQYAMRLYKLYGEDAKAALLDNPYLLVDEYFGADFSEADSLR